MCSIVNKDIWYSNLSKKQSKLTSSPDFQPREKKNFFHKIYRNKACHLWTSDGSDFDSISYGSEAEQILVSSKNGSVYTGSTSWTHYLHTGFVNQFDNIDAALHGKMSRSVDCCCGPFRKALILDADITEKLVVLFDAGTLCMLDSNLNPLKTINCTSFGPASDMCLNNDNSFLVVADHDKSLTVIDTNHFEMEKRFQYATGYSFSGVEFLPTENKVFVSCSENYTKENNTILFWDLRQPSPSSIFSTLSVPAKCLKWRGHSNDHFCVGTIDGSIFFYDKRKPGLVINKHQFVPRKSIDKIITINEGKRLVGLYNSNKLINVDALKIIETSLPSDFVIRDIVEVGAKLYAAGPASPNLYHMDNIL